MHDARLLVAVVKPGCVLHLAGVALPTTRRVTRTDPDELERSLNGCQWINLDVNVRWCPCPKAGRSTKAVPPVIAGLFGLSLSGADPEGLSVEKVPRAAIRLLSTWHPPGVWQLESYVLWQAFPAWYHRRKIGTRRRKTLS